MYSIEQETNDENKNYYETAETNQKTWYERNLQFLLKYVLEEQCIVSAPTVVRRAAMIENMTKVVASSV